MDGSSRYDNLSPSKFHARKKKHTAFGGVPAKTISTSVHSSPDCARKRWDSPTACKRATGTFA